ncbi:MAG: sugar phosphate isomerase/epimerase [Trueperaceae bacterium]|nr:sugar phosphate isomerase/epimerase [Trueperaceae bacterium]
MKLGYSSATAGIYKVDEAFKFAESLGLEFVELIYDYCDYLSDAQPAKRVRELKAATGIGVTLHLPFIDLNIASLIKVVRKASVEQTLEALEYARAIEASCGVLHTGHIFLYQPVPLEQAFEALYDSLSQFQAAGVPIALENLGLLVDGLVKGPEMLRHITDKFGMHNCLDVGHALIEANRPWADPLLANEDNISSYIDTLGERIIHLHLCNNNAQDDLHAPTTDGHIDFRNYSSFLNAFKGSICLEVAGGKEAVAKSVAHIRALEAVAI